MHGAHTSNDIREKGGAKNIKKGPYGRHGCGRGIRDHISHRGRSLHQINCHPHNLNYKRRKA
jgi:hypothetical protein